MDTSVDFDQRDFSAGAGGGPGGPTVGRTKYDFYASLKWYFVGFLVLILAIAFIWFLSGFGFDINIDWIYVSSYWPLVIAFFFGIYFFHWIYWRWIIRGVVIIKESSPMSCYILTKEYFDLIPGSLTAVNSSCTKRGLPVYRVKSMDLPAKVVDFGDVHLNKFSLGEVLTFSDKYYQMLIEYHKAELERNSMKDRIQILGMRLGREYSDELLRAVDLIARGKDPYSSAPDVAVSAPPDIKEVPKIEEVLDV